MSLTTPQSTVIERTLDAIEKDVRDRIHHAIPRDPLAGNVNDFGDEAAASTQQDFDHVLLERGLRDLQQVEAARRRLANGSADRCTDCGEEIDYERLVAYPFATRCIDCQSRHERSATGPAGDGW